MNEYEITLIQGDARTTVSLAEGTDLLTLISATKGYHLPAPCNGKGRCGKCRVRIMPADDGAGCEVTEPEEALLTATERAAGYRLACMCRPTKNATVVIPVESRAAFTKGTLPSVEGTPEPLFERKAMNLPTPILADQRSDYRRLLETAGVARGALDISSVRRLHEFAVADDYRVSALIDYLDHADGAIYGVSPFDAASRFALAVDIGTTTVAAYLVDLVDEVVIDVMSELNRQVAFGADVVSRIDASREKGIEVLQERIVSQLQEMGTSLCRRNGVDGSDIVACVAAGNTTMVHFLLGVDPAGIATAPFIPVLTDLFCEAASDVGFSFHPDARLVTLPNISGYVGADIVAAVLASEMHQKEEMSLLVDIGTNGEIVLGNKDGLVCCSTAAGPAFEGAHIQHGVGGVPGAVSEFARNGSGWVVQTIQGAEPIGICGSGIVDTVSLLISDAVLESTGRLKELDELSGETVEAYRGRLTDSAFAVVPGAGETKAAVQLTQGDIREVQLAKAAIAAGVRTLIDHAEIEMEDIQHLFLAGGFGSYIRRASAVQIGLIPPELADRVVSIGNAAGTGVATALLKRSSLAECRHIAATAEYLELSNSEVFQENYIEEMMFPGDE